jgi:hypothetical protein
MHQAIQKQGSGVNTPIQSDKSYGYGKWNPNMINIPKETTIAWISRKNKDEGKNSNPYL